MFPTLETASIVLIASLIVLVKGADLFLEAASRIAKHFGIGEFFIGLTIVSIGTSLPELATAITSSFAGKPALIMGNIVGSNIANIGLVLGLTLIFATIFVKKYEMEKMYIMLLSVFLFSLFITDLIISRTEAVILLVAFLLYFGHLFKLKEKFHHYKEYISQALALRGLLSLKRFREAKEAKKAKDKTKSRIPRKIIKEAYLYEIFRESITLVAGVILVILGARYTVSSAVDVAFFLNAPEAIVAALVIAVGTSLPELLVSITGVMKGHKKIVIGNLLGSNIFNVLAVIGIAGLINPIIVEASTLTFLLPSMLVFSFLAFYLFKKKQPMGRKDGILLGVVYILFMLALILFPRLL